MPSPTELTLKWLRNLGYEAEVTEQWKKFPGMAHGIRKDLFGFIDIVACGPGGTIGVQCTSNTGLNARITKINQEPKAIRWLASGNRIVVLGWRKHEKSGNRTVRQMEGVLIRGQSIDWVEAHIDEQPL